MGIKLQHWNVGEDQLLLETFEWAAMNTILSILPDRSWQAIKQRAHKTHNIYRKTQDKYAINHNFADKWSESLAYFLGFVLADGYIRYDYAGKTEHSRHEYAIEFELAHKDKDILEKFKEVLKYEGPVTYSKRETAKLRISNRRIIEAIIAKGIPYKDKTHTAKWISVPDEYLSAFVRGIFDGDGTISNTENYPNRLLFQVLGTKSIVDGISEAILKTTGYRLNVHYRGDYGLHGADVYVLSTSRIIKNMMPLFNWLYGGATIYLDRKYNKYKELLNRCLL